MDVETGIKSRLPNRHGTEDHGRASRRSRWHVGPEAAVGGPIGLIRADNTVEIDAIAGTLDANLTSGRYAGRKTKWRPRATNHTSSACWKYAQQIGSTVSGVLTFTGGACEKLRYADV
ncbi:MAG TPA: dihydroxy-acid dehydratase [Nitrobacter sp.]|nr:dihydroxy-acid dehydratase [Nitrobacter sp.]